MDLKLVVTEDGGDAQYINNDLELVEGFENMPLLGMFGGNVEASTQPTRLETEQDFSWWGNKVIWPNEPDKWFNSKTERTLRNVSLTSANRQVIQQAVEQDLAFMRSFAEFTVTVTYPAIDRVKISIAFTKPNNLQQQQFVYLWDATQSSLVNTSTVTSPSGTPNPTPTTPTLNQHTQLQSLLQLIL